MAENPEAVKQYDGEHGTYKDGVEGLSEADKLPQNQLPKAPDPSPFKLGPMAPGGR